MAHSLRLKPLTRLLAEKKWYQSHAEVGGQGAALMLARVLGSQLEPKCSSAPHRSVLTFGREIVVPDRARRRNKRQSVASGKYARSHQRCWVEHLGIWQSQAQEELPFLHPSQIHLHSLQKQTQPLMRTRMIGATTAEVIGSTEGP